MPQTNLITKTDIAAVYDVNVTVASVNWENAISTSQRNNLRFWLGEDLYYKLCENRADGDKYQALLEGETYEYRSGHNRYFDGVKMLLIWDSIATYLKSISTLDTKGGAVIPDKTHAKNLTGEELDKKISVARSQVITYHNLLKDYMSVKGSNFSEFTSIRNLQFIAFSI